MTKKSDKFYKRGSKKKHYICTGSNNTYIGRHAGQSLITGCNSVYDRIAAYERDVTGKSYLIGVNKGRMPIVVEENFIVEPEEFCIPEIELIDDGYRIKLNDKIRESFVNGHFNERDIEVNSWVVTKRKGEDVYVVPGVDIGPTKFPHEILVKRAILPNGEVIAQNEDPNMPNYKKPIYNCSHEELSEAMVKPIRDALALSGVVKDPKIDFGELNVQ